MMSDVIYTTICFGTGFFFGVFATIIALVVIEDTYEKKAGRKK